MRRCKNYLEINSIKYWLNYNETLHVLQVFQQFINTVYYCLISASSDSLSWLE